MKIVYQDTDAKTVGNLSDKFNTIAGFNAGATAILAQRGPHRQPTAALRSVTPRRRPYSATLKCHDPNGELYMVNFSRDQVTLTSYSDEAIRTKVETWADSVAALA